MGVHRLSTVSVDNEQGGFLAGSYLLQMGHRQSRVAERKKGFLKAVEVSPANPSATVLHGDQNFLVGYRLAWKLISDHPDVTAVSTHNDVMAFGALKAFAEAGWSVPADISIIGFDNVDISEMVQPSLTTINQPKYEIGKGAVEVLLQWRNSPKPATPIHRVFGGSLVGGVDDPGRNRLPASAESIAAESIA